METLNLSMIQPPTLDRETECTNKTYKTEKQQKIRQCCKGIIKSFSTSQIEYSSATTTSFMSEYLEAFPVNN